MSQKQAVASFRQMGKIKRGGKAVPAYRVVNAQTGEPLQNREEKFLDGGGYHLENMAKRKADDINEYYLRKKT
jgi:hypothetical protein